MASTNDIGLASERIQSAAQVDLNELTCSTICENILWKPVSCQQCETHFCSMCIRQWLHKHPNQCPMRCASFIERPCSKFVARQLAKLQITCAYQPNGCQEIVPYEALEKHETTCGYQRIKCTGCQSDILRRNLAEHQSICQPTTTTCCVRNESNSREQQSDVAALRVELRQLREALNYQMELLVTRDIIADDNRFIRIELKSTVEIDTLHKDRVVLDTASSLPDNVICSQCGNIFWKPVSCQKCGTAFCAKCCPTGGFFGKISSFFNFQGKYHGQNQCESFEETRISGQLINELTKLRFRCAYAPNGCHVLSSYYDLEQHERTCEFERIPCKICQLPLSKRSPVVEHTQRACFEHMHNKNPSGIQEQFMMLFKTLDETKAENRRLQSTIDQMQKELKTLTSTRDNKKSSQ